MLKKMIQKIVLVCMMVFLATGQAVLPVSAVTVYESDGVYHEEGYIVIGESHSVLAAHAMGIKANEVGNVFHVGENADILYVHQWDGSRGVTKSGSDNTFTMRGNLFFVFEGNNAGVDDVIQTSKEYIYSDGNGKRGRGVEKIHEIIDCNPNIAHWNTISIHGGVAASKGSKEIANYYVDSYRNWMTYEFPDADCYFLSVATMTRYYRPTRDKKVFNDTLQSAFPDAFLDYTDFYAARSPQRMIDTIHWDHETYAELILDVLQNVTAKRQEQCQEQLQNTPIEFTVTEVQAVLCTNDRTVIYEQPSPGSNVILPSCEAGIPIQVTGITSNGFFRVCVSPDNTASYIAGDGLMPMP